MAKKNYDKKISKKEVNEVLDKAIISEVIVEEVADSFEKTIEEDEPILEESLTLDIDKFSKDLEEMKKELFEEELKKEEVIEESKENKNKSLINRIFGLSWNGQEFDY
jgi:hypothetical protein